MVLPDWNVDPPPDYQYIEKPMMYWPDRNGKEPLWKYALKLYRSGTCKVKWIIQVIWVLF